jgi:glycosyltransferase involved in cell wall biosynthesis
MHDHVVRKPTSSWRKLRASGLRVVNFCRATHALFSGLGFESLCLQYWQPRLAQSVGMNEAPRVFFWARKGQIGWPLLKSLLGEQRPERIVFRAAADPGESLSMPSADDTREYRIEVITGWLDKAQYLELLTSCNVFMAPRLYEGIGQSFLEAMSLGLAVVAPDSPTMNEYIQHGRNGYLYASASPAPVDFSRLGTIREQALHDVSAGCLAWQAQEAALLAYLSSPARPEQGLIWRVRRMLSPSNLVDRFSRRSIE